MVTKYLKLRIARLKFFYSLFFCLPEHIPSQADSRRTRQGRYGGGSSKDHPVILELDTKDVIYFFQQPFIRLLSNRICSALPINQISFPADRKRVKIQHKTDGLILLTHYIPLLLLDNPRKLFFKNMGYLLKNAKLWKCP